MSIPKINPEIIDSQDILQKNTDVSKIKNDIKENLEDTNVAKTLFDLKKREKDGKIYTYM
jgi:hypothetical protein